MKPKAESVTHANFTGNPLRDNSRKEILHILKDKFPEEAAVKFVKAVNGAIVHAYELVPRMSTLGQRREWFTKVSKATKSLLEVLREADIDPEDVSKAMSEDLERLDIVLCEHFKRECESRADSLIVPVLQKLAGEADTQVKKLGRGNKTAGPQQQLANQLALAWCIYFDQKPTSSVSMNRDHDSYSPFIGVLRVAIRSAEVDRTEEPTIKVVSKLAEHAITWLNKQDEHIARHIPR